MRQHQNPWELGQALQGHEFAVDTPILEVLLNNTVNLLAADVSNPPLRHAVTKALRPLMLLRSMNRLALPDCFRHCRESALEQNLTTWLFDRWRHRGDSLELETTYGLEILAKIGGPGLTAVANHCLEAGEQDVRLWGLKVAEQRPDSTTIRLLGTISLREDLWNNERAEQGFAAMTFAAIGCWRDVVAYIVRWCLRTIPSVIEHRFEAGVLDDDTMSPALAAMRHEPLPSPGVIVALGFGGRKDRLPFIRDTLARVAPDSEIAHACVLVIDWLQDTDPATVHLLEQQLDIPTHRRASVNALLENGTDAALEALLRHTHVQYQHGTALALLSDQRTRPRVIPLIRCQLTEADPHSRLEMLSSLSELAQSNQSVDEVLADPCLRDFLRETAFDNERAWPASFRVTAIWGWPASILQRLFWPRGPLCEMKKPKSVNAIPIWSWSWIRKVPCHCCWNRRWTRRPV